MNSVRAKADKEPSLVEGLHGKERQAWFKEKAEKVAANPKVIAKAKAILKANQELTDDEI